MDRDKLKLLEIEATQLDEIEDALVEKQNDLETRMDNAESNGNMERKKQLEVELSEVEELLKQVREEIKAAASKPAETEVAEASKKEEKARGVVPTSIEEGSRVVPTAISKSEELADSIAGKLSGVRSALGGKRAEEKESAKAKAEEKAKEASEKKHEDELKAKAAELRKKAAQEEAAKEKAEKEARKAAEKEAEKETKEVTPETISEHEKDFNEGVAAFANGQYREAFRKIFRVANAGDASGLGKDKLGQAEQLLARMYRDGKGVDAKDESRGIFWFEKAAEHGNIEGCLAMGQHYADQTPKSPQDEDKFRKEALKYFKLAGSKDSKVGKEKFIEICEKRKSQISFVDARIACQYLDDLIEAEKDSFIKDRLQSRKKELMDRPKDRGARRNNTSTFKGMSDVFAILSALLTTFGMMLVSNFVFTGKDTFLTFERFIPKFFLETWLPEFLEEGIESIYPEVFEGFYTALCYNLPQTGPEQGIFWAFVIVPLGLMIGATSRVEKRGAIANILCEASLWFAAIIYTVVMHYALITVKGYIGASAILYVLEALAFVVVFRLPGLLVRKIIGE